MVFILVNSPRIILILTIVIFFALLRSNILLGTMRQYQAFVTRIFIL